MLNASGQIIATSHDLLKRFVKSSLVEYYYILARCITFSMSLVQLLGPLPRRRGDGKATAPSRSGWKILDATCTETWAKNKPAV